MENVENLVIHDLSREDKNLDNLFKYSQMLGIEIKVMSYIDLVRI